jgi:hypothetical protein
MQPEYFFGSTDSPHSGLSGDIIFFKIRPWEHFLRDSGFSQILKANPQFLARTPFKFFKFFLYFFHILLFSEKLTQKCKKCKVLKVPNLGK